MQPFKKSRTEFEFYKSQVRSSKVLLRISKKTGGVLKNPFFRRNVFEILHFLGFTQVFDAFSVL